MDVEAFARQVGHLVRERRKALGMTQSQLALCVGVSRRFIVTLEMGQAQSVRMNLLLSVFDLLGITIAVSTEEDDALVDRLEGKPLSLLSEKRAGPEEDAYASAFAYAVESLERPVE